jgi:hypothetical protein
MKVLLEINDDNAPALLEVLKGLPYVITETIVDSKDEFLAELQESIQQVKSAKEGKVKLKTVDELIDEL